MPKVSGKKSHRSPSVLQVDLKGKTPFRRSLLRWFSQNQRKLPWRSTGKSRPDAYRVWVSEIMLQQTRVAAVLEHYRRFLKQFPTVRRLATVTEEQVLTAWSGLGYYRRARMMHAAARQLVTERQGRIPTSSIELQTLPGVGRYTAAAIASIAFEEPVAVVDGNVERVICRIFGAPARNSPVVKASDVWAIAQNLLDPLHPGDFNQAMMELGALVCLPKRPRCGKCPVKAWCGTRGAHIQPPRPARRSATLHYALARRGNSVRLVQRSATHGLMANMWELPASPGKPNGGTELMSLRHCITSTDYHVTVHAVERNVLPDGKWISKAELKQIPLTGLTRKILQRLDLLHNPKSK